MNESSDAVNNMEDQADQIAGNAKKDWISTIVSLEMA